MPEESRSSKFPEVQRSQMFGRASRIVRLGMKAQSFQFKESRSSDMQVRSKESAVMQSAPDKAKERNHAIRRLFTSMSYHNVMLSVAVFWDGPHHSAPRLI